MLPDALWKIELFGGLCAYSAHQTLTRFRTRKAAALLARLAYKRGEMQSRDELIEMLWPDCDPADGRNRLNVELSALRKALQVADVPSTDLLHSDRWSIQCRAELVTTDVAEFDARRQRALSAGTPLEQSQWLQQAMDLYRAPLLPMQEQEWVESARRHYANLFFELSSRQVTLLQAQGDSEQAIACARRAASLDADREEAQELLMRALLYAGQNATVQQHYAQWHKRVQEWDGEPSEAITQIAAQARREQALKTNALPSLTARPSKQQNALSAARGEWPTGTVTFLVTDIEGSTPLARKAGDSYETARERHHVLLRSEFAHYDGREYKEVGDGFWVVFKTTGEALDCAVACQRALAAEAWPQSVGNLLVRMGLHVADVQFKDGEYRGIGLHELSRLVPAAHGGQILVSQALAQVAPHSLPQGVEMRNLGNFRLRDAPGPEPLFQLNYPGMARAEFSPPNAPRACVPNLPPTFTRFVGRETELARLADLLVSPTTQLVTLTGMGGLGKTRLAIEIARHLTDAYDGAVYFVPLEGALPAQIVDTILIALRQEHVPDKDALEQLIPILAEQPTLLVLDNFEELVDEGAGLVQTLLHQAPTLTCLLTSRRSLGVVMEQEFEVAPLPVPQKTDWQQVQNSISSTLNSPTGCSFADISPQLAALPSVQLFVDRVCKHRLDFQLTPRNQAAIAELCARLEGIPLALELAASWAKILSPAQMLTQLKAVLVTRDRNAPERHRSLDAAIEASYRLLSPELQRFFTCLSVFRGGWTLEAAQEVCTELHTLDHLMQLRERSLILSDESGAEMRFRLLETLREFGESRLCESNTQEAVRHRHLTYFRYLAEQADAQLQGAEQAQWLHRLETERHNLRAALTYADVETRLKIASDLQWFWIIRAQLQEGRAWLEGALSRRATMTDALTLQARSNAGILAWQAGDFPVAREHLNACLDLYQAQNNERGVARTLVNLANLASEQGDYATARANYELSLTLWRNLGEKHPIAVTLSNIGALAIMMSDNDAGLAFLEEALSLQQATGDSSLHANILHNMAEMYRDRRNFVAAQQCIRECLHIRLALEDQHTICNLTDLLVAIAYDLEQYERAAWLVGALEAASNHTGIPWDSHSHSHIQDISKLQSKMPFSVFEQAYNAGRMASWQQIITAISDMEAMKM